MRKLFIILALLILPLGVMAQVSGGGSNVNISGGGDIGGLDVTNLQTGIPGSHDPAKEGPAALVANFYEFALLIGGLLAFGSILFGGIQYLTSGGSPSGQHEAKERIQDALLGLLLLIGIYVVLNFINPDLTKLRFPTLKRLEKVEAPNLISTMYTCKNASLEQNGCYVDNKCDGSCQQGETCEPSAICTSSGNKQGVYVCIRPGGLFDNTTTMTCYEDDKCGNTCTGDNQCVKAPANYCGGGADAENYGYKGVDPRGNLTDAAARSQLAEFNQGKSYSIAINKLDCQNVPSATCIKEHKNCESCTSLDGIPQSAIDGIKKIASACKCNLTITGGTEAGHSTHGLGKPILDVRPGAVDTFFNAWASITQWSDYQKVQTQYGNIMWEKMHGTQPAHWHLTF